MTFKEMLLKNSTEIKESRAKILIETAEDAQFEIVRQLRKERRNLTTKLLSLTDIYPDSELSMRVVKDKFNANSLFNEIQGIKVELANKAVELRLAGETYVEYFGKLADESRLTATKSKK